MSIAPGGVDFESAANLSGGVGAVEVVGAGRELNGKVGCIEKITAQAGRGDAEHIAGVDRRPVIAVVLERGGREAAIQRETVHGDAGASRAPAGDTGVLLTGIRATL